jgi:hypothetical protein
MRWPWLLALLVIAAAYYGSYFRHGINFRDEGGTLTLLGQRLLNGEIPYRDVELGYNIGWFIPIVALFKVMGVHFVGLRVFFMVLSTLAAVFGFLTVHRAARHAGRHALALPLAFATGIILVLVPGMLFKNYNPLAAVLNSWCLLGFVLAVSAREAAWRALAGGFVLGATWLVRIDLGTFFSLLWLGTLIFRLFGRSGTFRERLIVSGAAILILSASVVAIHAPVLWDGHKRGYDFLGRYPGEWKRMFGRLTALTGGEGTQARVAANDPVAQAKAPRVTQPPKQGSWKKETLSRVHWSEVSEASEKDRDDVLGLFLLTYFPLLTMIPLIGWATWRWLGAVRGGGDSSGPLAALVLLGGALTMFPQFFFWRPDAPHLSEFGPGYWMAVIGATALLGAGISWRAPARWLTVLLFLHCGVWFWRMLPDRWCGTIAARSNRKIMFEGENGVRVFEQKKTVAWMNDVLRLIRERSRAGDYLVAYPYHPSFNVLANRPTCEKSVYIDNAEARPGWGKAAIERIEKFRPAMIIVSDWDPNGTEASRFRNWANDVYLHIRSNYELLGTFDEKEKFEVYARKRALTPAP